MFNDDVSKLFEKANINNDSESHLEIAKNFRYGSGNFPKDLTQAKKHYLKAFLPSIEKDWTWEDYFQLEKLPGWSYFNNIEEEEEESKQKNSNVDSDEENSSTPISTHFPFLYHYYENVLKEIEKNFGKKFEADILFKTASLKNLCIKTIFINNLPLNKLPTDLQVATQEYAHIVNSK